MILVDTNILVYSRTGGARQQTAAASWLDEQLAGPARVGLPWESLVGYTRIMSNPRIFSRAMAVGQAWEHVEDWLGRPSAWTPVPGDRHREVLGELLRVVRPASAVVHDAHLAALAIEHGLVLASTDRDFARFPGLRWENPLAEAG